MFAVRRIAICFYGNMFVTEIFSYKRTSGHQPRLSVCAQLSCVRARWPSLIGPRHYQGPSSIKLNSLSAPPLPPQFLGANDRINLTFLPPFFLIAHRMERAVVGDTKRHRPLVTHLAAHGPRLGKAKMMCMAR